MRVIENFAELLREYIRGNEAQYPDLLIPRVRPVPANIAGVNFKGSVFDKGFETLNFKTFLHSIYPRERLHTDQHTVGSLQADLARTYPGFKDEWFESNGQISSVLLHELIYYQDEIDLRGRHPLNGNFDEPVKIVSYNDHKVLYNGYHRACMHMLLRQNEIAAYILRV